MSTSVLSALLPLTRDRSDARFRKHAVSFIPCLVCGLSTYNLAALPITVDRSNAKLGEDVTCLFESLLAVFRAGSLARSENI